MTAELRISPDLALPLEAVTEPMGMLAARRAGKSNAAVVIAEEMFRNHLHWVAIDPKGDWWGIRSGADGEKGGGLDVPIFGGAHADVPLEPTAGALIADLIVDQRLTCLLDVSGFASEADKIRFLLAFGDRLFRRKERGQEPTHVFFEEADDYVPQRAFPEQQRLVHVMARILKQGGSRGLGGTVISQRSAVVHKDILSQVQTMFALRTTGPQDRKAIRDWVSFSGENPEIVESLPELQDGEAWVWSPNFLRLTKRFQFRRRATFDSGATPKIGESRQAPATLADVDLGAIATSMAATIERAKATDPKELQARIRVLERQLHERPLETKVEERVVEKVVEVPVLNGQVDDLRAVVSQLASVGEQLVGVAGSITSAIERVSGARREVASMRPGPVQRPEPVRKAPTPAQWDRGTTGQTATVTSPSSEAAGEVKLKAGARRMLEALARLHPTALSRSQVGTLADVAATGGTFGDYLSALRGAGLVEETPERLLALTETGLGLVASHVGTGAPSTVELVDLWGRKLKAGARRMLDVLVEAYPGSLSREELGERSGVAPAGGTFGDYLSALRRLDLLEDVGRDVRAGEALFLGK